MVFSRELPFRNHYFWVSIVSFRARFGAVSCSSCTKVSCRADSQEDVGFFAGTFGNSHQKGVPCMYWLVFVAYFVSFLETREWWSDGVGWCGMCHVFACLQDTFHSTESFFVWLGGTILPEHCSYLKDTGKSWPQQPRKAQGLSRSPLH